MLPSPGDFPLTGEGLRGFLEHSYLPAVVHDNSGASILKAIRAVGGKIRTDDFYVIRRRVLGITVHQEALTANPDDISIPVSYYNDTHEWQLNTKFLYKFDVRGIDPVTGEPVETGFHLGSDRELTKEEAYNQLSSKLMGLSEYYGVSDYEMEMVAALATPGAFY